MVGNYSYLTKLTFTAGSPSSASTSTSSTSSQTIYLDFKVLHQKFSPLEFFSMEAGNSKKKDLDYS